jgi:TolB-like protein/Flp pilus assembly protein TadD
LPGLVNAPPMNESTNAVFLSYASQDADAARRIGEALREAGVEVWLDTSELRGGDAWDAAIRKQIRACALFMPVISANTRARPEGYFRLEWKLAVDRSHLMADEKAFLLPVVIDATRDADGFVPDRFREVQWTYLQAGTVPADFVNRVALLLAAGGRVASITGLPRPGTMPAAAPRREANAIGLVAVLPFANTTGDPAIEYLSDGIAECLINKLSSLKGLRVISRTSAFAFKGKGMEATEIGRRLGTDALVLGSLAQRGSSVTITAELVRVGDATQLWGERYARPADDLMQVEGEIAATIARTLRRRLSVGEKARLARAETSDPEAFRLYLRGRSFLVGNQQEMDKSVDCFLQAVARAPGYAMAYAGLAEAYTTQAYLRAVDRTAFVERARAAVSRALELDPDLAEAHTALGLVRFYFEWDWEGADAAFRRAIELNPGSQAVNEEYGAFLNALGRFDEGLARTRIAAALDPLSVGPVHNLAINAMVQGDYDEAAAGFRRAIDIDPNWTWGYIKLARTLALQQKCKEAFAQAEIAERRLAGGVAPLSWSWLGVAYATCGDVARARAKLDQLHALEAKQYVDPVTFAQIHGALGELDEALGWYEKAFADRTTNMVYAAIAPGLSPELVGNARYQAIVDRMGIPTAAQPAS